MTNIEQQQHCVHKMLLLPLAEGRLSLTRMLKNCLAWCCRVTVSEGLRSSLHSVTQDLLWWALYKAEPLLLGSSLRQKALAKAIEYIHFEVNSWYAANYQAPLQGS